MTKRSSLVAFAVSLAAAGGIAGGLVATSGGGFDILGAYNAAPDGGIVAIPAGSYGEVDLYACSSKRVSFVGAGDSTYVGKIDDGCASNVTFQNLRVGAIIVQNANKPPGTTHDVVIDHVNGGLFYVQGPAANVTVTSGVWGNVTDSHPTLQQYNPGENGPSHVVIEGNVFHDFHRSGTGVHTECLQVRQASDVVVRNNRMWNCDGTADLTIGDAPQSNFTVEGNHLGLGGDGPYSAQIGNSVNGLVFRGNVATGAVIWGSPAGTPAPGGQIVFDSNLLVWSTALCRYGTFTNDTMTGGTCSSSDRQVASLGTVNLTDNLEQAGTPPPTPPPPPPPPPTGPTGPSGLTGPTGASGTTGPAGYSPKCATTCDERIAAARRHLNAQAALWRAQGWSWARIKTQPAWSALKDLG